MSTASRIIARCLQPQAAQVHGEAGQYGIAGDCLGIIETLDYRVGAIDIDFPLERIDQPARRTQLSMYSSIFACSPASESFSERTSAMKSGQS